MRSPTLNVLDASIGACSGSKYSKGDRIDDTPEKVSLASSQFFERNNLQEAVKAPVPITSM